MRRPSLFFQAFFLCLAVAGWIALVGGNDEPLDPRVEGLLRRGWQWQDGLPCSDLSVGKFYEVGGDEQSVELLVLDGERALASSESWPEAPNTCTEINEPSLIQELL